MAANNSIQQFTRPTTKSMQDTVGITAFDKTGSWNQIIGGLVFQGGKITAAGAVSFQQRYQKQLLYLSVSAGTFSAETVGGFTASAACYWFSIGA